MYEPHPPLMMTLAPSLPSTPFSRLGLLSLAFLLANMPRKPVFRSLGLMLSPLPPPASLSLSRSRSLSDVRCCDDAADELDGAIVKLSLTCVTTRLLLLLCLELSFGLADDGGGLGPREGA